MIGTNSPFRMRAVFFLLALIAAGLSFVLGCGEAPFSVSSGDNSVAYGAMPAPKGHRPDAATTTGFVEAIDHDALRLCVGGLWFFTDNETEIEVDDCRPCMFSSIQVGDPAKVKHDRFPAVDGTYYAREIEVEHEEEEDVAETVGVVERVEANRLLVDGSWFWFDGTTDIEIDGDCMLDAIIAGDPVKIEHAAVMSDGLGYYAFKIEVERDCDEDEDDEIEEE